MSLLHGGGEDDAAPYPAETPWYRWPFPRPGCIRNHCAIGHRERVWETRVGESPLRIPKVWDGSYFPSLLEPRRRSEKALLAVVQQAYG